MDGELFHTMQLSLLFKNFRDPFAFSSFLNFLHSKGADIN